MMTLNDLLALVNEQAMDHGIWGVAQTIQEEYIQEALRKLHQAIEQFAGESDGLDS